MVRTMRLSEPEKHCYFCLYCAREINMRIPYEEPPSFIEGRECENCSHSVWAYSPPATVRNQVY